MIFNGEKQVRCKHLLLTPSKWQDLYIGASTLFISGAAVKRLDHNFKKEILLIRNLKVQSEVLKYISFKF